MLSVFRQDLRDITSALVWFKNSSFKEKLEGLANTNFAIGILTLSVLDTLSFTGVAILTVSLMGLPQAEHEVNAMLAQPSFVNAFAMLALVAPWVETALFHFTPLVLVVAAFRGSRRKIQLAADASVIGATIVVFAFAHGYNVEGFSWHSVIFRVPAGVFLTFITYANLRYYRGDFEARAVRAFGAAFFLHALNNATVLMMFRMGEG